MYQIKYNLVYKQTFTSVYINLEYITQKNHILVFYMHQ